MKQRTRQALAMSTLILLASCKQIPDDPFVPEIVPGVGGINFVQGSKDVPKAEVEKIAGYFQKYFDKEWFNASGQDKIKNRLTEVVVTEGSDISLAGTVLTVGYGATDLAINDYIYDNTDLLALLQQSKTIKMANGKKQKVMFDYSNGNAKSA